MGDIADEPIDSQIAVNVKGVIYTAQIVAAVAQAGEHRARVHR
jgi:hypothetical protein